MWIVLAPLIAAILFTIHVLVQGAQKKVDPRGKAVLITGCDTGFGYHLALRLARIGFTVFAACLTPDGIEGLEAQQLPTLHPVRMDVTSEEDVARVLREMEPTLADTGGLFALVNNAGISAGFVAQWNSVEHYQRVMDVNFIGTCRCTLACLPQIKRARGRVLIVSSIAAYVSGPGMSSYAASKHAVQAFADAVRLEMVPWEVQVGTVNPSFHRTPIVERVRGDAKRMWDGLPDSLRAEYGADFIDRQLKRVDDVLMVCGDPQRVVDKMEQMLLVARMPTRVVVGRDPFAFLAYCPPLARWLVSVTMRKPANPHGGVTA